MMGASPTNSRAPLRTPGSTTSPAEPRADKAGQPGSSGEGSGPIPAAVGRAIEIPDHVLLRIVGRGAYGEVWLARSALGTLRAVKLVRLEDFAETRPFEREFRGIQKYEPVSRGHQGLIDILQVGRHPAGRYFYYVMELADPAVEVPGCQAEEPYAENNRRAAGCENQASALQAPVEGSREGGGTDGYVPRTLRQEIRTRGSLPAQECVRFGLAIVGAIEHLHGAGLVHRDIKPSNIVFVGGEVKLADIGLIAGVDDERSVVGTEGYLPPEGGGTPDADLYSLGKVLYEMSTGLNRRHFPELPAETGDPVEAVRFRELNEIVLKACARDPARRYRNATALRLDLERLRHGQSLRQRRRWEAAGHRLRQVLPALLLLTVLLAAVWAVLGRRPISRPLADAERAAVFVLPFRGENQSDPAIDRLCGRMTDAFIDTLASLEGVRRSPRRSGWVGRDESELLRSLARTNDMRHILCGDLSLREGILGLRLRLYERAAERLVWEETFRGAATEVIPLERRALDRLAGVLGIRLTDAESGRLDLVLKRKDEAGRLVAEGWRQYERDALIQTGYTAIIALSESARRIDPDSLEARFLRGGVMRDLALVSRPPAEAFPELLREMSAILEVDETHRAALNFMAGCMLFRDWNWAAYDAFYQRQLRWETGRGQHFIRALWLRTHGLPEARSEQRLAEQDEFTDLAGLSHGAAARWVDGEYDEGIRIAERALRLQPEAIWPFFWLAQLHATRGSYDEALEAIRRLEQRSQVPIVTALRGYVYARMGQNLEARQVIDELAALERTTAHVPSYWVARIFAALGDLEKALDRLEQAESERSEFLVFADFGGLRTDRAWVALDDHPRFNALLKKVGLEQWPVPIHPAP